MHTGKGCADGEVFIHIHGHTGCTADAVEGVTGGNAAGELRVVNLCIGPEGVLVAGLACIRHTALGVISCGSGGGATDTAVERADAVADAAQLTLHLAAPSNVEGGYTGPCY